MAEPPPNVFWALRSLLPSTPPLVQDVLLLCLGGRREEEGGSAVLMQRVPGQLALLAVPSF